MNYDLYRSYLALLVEKGYVAVSPNAEEVEIVSLTPEGRAARDRLVGWIRDAFGDVRL